MTSREEELRKYTIAECGDLDEIWDLLDACRAELAEARAWIARQPCENQHSAQQCVLAGQCGAVDAGYGCTPDEAEQAGCLDWEGPDCGKCFPCRERARER